MKELKQIEKLTGKSIRRLESEWPMTVFEETVKQARPPRPGREAKPETPKKAPQKPVRTNVKPQSGPAPQSKATPLERPVTVRPSRPEREEQPVRSHQRPQAEKPAYTYADLLKERRKTRRPLSTGNDRV